MNMNHATSRIHQSTPVSNDVKYPLYFKCCFSTEENFTLPILEMLPHNKHALVQEGSEIRHLWVHSYAQYMQNFILWVTYNVMQQWLCSSGCEAVAVNGLNLGDTLPFRPAVGMRLVY